MEVHLLHPCCLASISLKETKSAFLQAQASARLDNVSIQATILSYPLHFYVQGSWCHNVAVIEDPHIIYIFTNMGKPQFMLLHMTGSHHFEKQDC